MKTLNKTLTLLLIHFLFCFKVEAQSGDLCSAPMQVNCCNTSLSSVNTASGFANDVTNWSFGSASGDDIFYQINLPASNYTPVSLNAGFSGSFNNTIVPTKVYFLWFETYSPLCGQTNPIEVDSFEITGSPFIRDSFCFSHNIVDTLATYYLVVDFKTSLSYNYRIYPRYSNDQPLPNITCSPAPPPYKGLLELDQSSCYTSASPYNLPLSQILDIPYYTNHLEPQYNQSANYLPVFDNNGIGYVVTLKRLYNNDEFYKAYNSSPYSYASNSIYTVAITVFLKNDIGAAGLKGFKIKVPGSTVNNSTTYPMNGALGIYNTSHSWYSFAYGNQCIWMFNGLSGRGDNISDNGYGCKKYTFSFTVNNLEDTIKAWYLSDYYGNDDEICVFDPSNPPRTDCGIACSSPYENWEPLGANAITMTGGSCTPSAPVPCNGYVYGICELTSFDCNDGNQDPQNVPLDASGCPVDYQISWQYIPDDYSPQNGFPVWGGDTYDSICNIDTFQLMIDYAYSNGEPMALLFLDGNGNYYLVDANGNIDFNQLVNPYYLCYYVSYWGSYPLNNFSIPLTTQGIYQFYYGYYGGCQFYSCFGNLHLYVESADLNTSVEDTTICEGEQLLISVAGGSNYLWSPDLAISSTTGSTVTVNPTTDMTYTVTGENTNGCTGFTTVTVHINAAGLDASFTPLASHYCPNTPPVTLTPVTAGGVFSGPGVTGNTFDPSIAGLGGPYIINYSLGGTACNQSSQITSVENPIADIVPPGPLVPACFNQAVPLTTLYDPGYTYKWKRGNFIIPGATNNSFTPFSSGIYKYTVKITDVAGGGCVSKDSVYYNLINFPNPTLIVGACINNTILLSSSVTDPDLNYQWIKWNTPISGATNTSYTVTSNGAYRVAITDSCGTLRFTPLTVFNVTNCRSEEISESEAEQLFDVTLYPNPNEGTFTIDLNTYDLAKTEIEIEVFNVLGQIAYEKTLSVSDGKLNALIQLPSSVASGIYNVRIKKDNFETYKKIVVSK